MAKTKQEEITKITIELPKTVVQNLHIISLAELTGSRGRTIEWLIRYYQINEAIKDEKKVEK